METLARWGVRRPVAVAVMATAIVILGWMAWQRLPQDLLPDIQSPTIVVSVRSGGRPPAEMEQMYGEQVEQRLFAVRGIRDVTQVAWTGRLLATVVFDWDADMDLALVDVQKAVSPIAAQADVDEVLVRRFDPRQAPVISAGLIAPGGRPDLAELRRIARRQVAPALERLEGVAEVRVTGGREREVRVQLDRHRLDSYGVTPAELESRLRAANIDINAGTIEEGQQVFLVRGLSRFHAPADVAAVVVRYQREASGNLVPVRVSDLGTVSLEDRDITHLVLVDGTEGVGLSIFKEAGANTVAVSRTVRGALDRLGADLPGVQVRLVADEAGLIEDALRDVQEALAVGIALSVLVLVFFLRAAAPVLVVSTAVPVSLFATLFFMHLADQSINLMTLAGLALGAGNFVDNAIVVVESIYRRLAGGEAIAEAAARGTGEVGGAIAASTLTTCIVFLPVLFVRGLAARLVEGIAFTTVVSMLASLAAGVLLIPALSRWLVLRHSGRALDPGARRLEALVARLLRRPAIVVLAGIAVVAASLLGLRQLGTELLPPADPRQFSLRLVGPPGQRVEATAAAVGQVEHILRQAGGKDIRSVLSEVGQVPEDDRLIREEQSEENTARMIVRLAAGGLSAGQVVAAAAPAVHNLSGQEISWEVGASALARALGTTGPPVLVEIAGLSLEELRQGAEDVRRRLLERRELWNVRSSFEGGPPEIRVVLDRRLADAQGVDVERVTAALETALDGRETTRVYAGDEEYEVVLRFPRWRRDQLLALPLAGGLGQRLALGDVARLEPVTGAREIFRRDQRRVARVTARVAPGADFPRAIAAAREAALAAELPPGTTLKFIGEEEERERTFRELRLAAGLALLLVFMVLAGTFESLLQPATVLAAVPLSLAGVALFLLPAGQPVGVMAMLGLIVLAGVAVNDAILLVDAARGFIRDGVPPDQALARAAGVRLRPILMTTLTTVLALLPLAFGTSEAAKLRRPLALTVIGGMAASVAASLFVIPCLYALLDRLRPRRR